MQMPIITSRYWNMAFGANPEELKKDREGMQIMRILGKNMAWFLKCKQAGEKAGIALPEQEKFESSIVSELCCVRISPQGSCRALCKPQDRHHRELRSKQRCRLQV